MPNYSDDRLLVPGATDALNRLKFEVAGEIAYPDAAGTHRVNLSQGNYTQQLDSLKYEVAAELGILGEIRERGWADMPSKEMGRIGGRLGGPIGGHMVRRMVALAEQHLAQGGRLPEA